MSFLPPKHDNSTPPISNWPNGWGRHSFLFSGAQHGTGSREFGLRTSSTETEAFGLWMKTWRESAPTKGAFGMRLFDAGEFHVGFGIVVPSDEETTEFSPTYFDRVVEQAFDAPKERDHESWRHRFGRGRADAWR